MARPPSITLVSSLPSESPLTARHALLPLRAPIDFGISGVRGFALLTRRSPLLRGKGGKMSFEIADKDALARSMMLSLAVDRGLPENPEEAIRTLWEYYSLAQGELRVIEHQKDSILRDALKGLGEPFEQQP